MLDIDDENTTYVFCIQGHLGYVFELEFIIIQSVWQIKIMKLKNKLILDRIINDIIN